MTSVSVVIAVYNGAWCIEPAIEGVLAQTRPALELIVADDGSTDGTPELLEKRFGSAVRVLRLPHRNASAARREGFAEARGDWLAFLDADDVWRPGKLESQCRFVEAHPEMAWVTCDGRYVEAGRVLRESWLSDYFRPVRETVGDLLPALVQRCFPLVSATMVRRDAYEAIGGLDPAMVYSHDYDLWLRLAARFPGGICSDRAVDYARVPGSLSRDLSARFRDDLLLMRRIEGGALSAAPEIRRAAAERAAGLEFDLAILELRAGKSESARERLRRIAGIGSWRRRAIAWAGTLLPLAVVRPLLRSPALKRAVGGARRGPGPGALPLGESRS